MGEVLRIAVQKKGRLSDDSLKLIKECGISFSKSGGTLKAEAYNFPLEFLFLRDDDIPGYVQDGVADIGIVGENEHVEKRKNVNIVKRLGFSKCRLSIGMLKNAEYNGLQDLQNSKIATSYPNLLQDWLDEKKIKAEIHEISGSVEIAPSIGLADAICDIVSTGSTLISNGLKEVEKIFKSEALLISDKNLSEEKKIILDRLLFRMQAVMEAKNSKYITLNAPNTAIDAIIKILPGVKSPSVTPLYQKDWSSIHSVVDENEFWPIIETLKNAGAEGILVLPIEKIIK